MSHNEHEMQKVAREKMKGEEKNFGRAIAKRKSKFWLMHMPQDIMLFIFVPNLGEIYLFG